jgi:hypothetical protein
MKSIYICGDSFARKDPEYGPCWVDLLEKKLGKQATITNNSLVSGSNLLISLQVDRAIAESADFIICLCTSSVRGTAAVDNNGRDLLDRFHTGSLVPFSINSVAERVPELTTAQAQAIRSYYTEFFDLPLAIYENQCIIENTLNRLVKSGIPFLFDQGGFEHPKFGGVKDRYFKEFKSFRAEYNLWDYADVNLYRPYFHITDQQVHEMIADYYFTAVNK